MSTSCGAPGSWRFMTRCTLSSSAMRLTLVCSLPAVSMSSTFVPSRLAACIESWATAAASAPRSRATTGVPVRSPHCCNCSMAAALKVSPAANIVVPGRKRESLPMVVVLPVPLTPTIRMTVGSCETLSSTGPSSMRVACSIMSSRSSFPLVMFFSKASCSSSATSLAVVGTPTSEEIKISSTRSQNSSSSASLNSATAALSCPTNDSRLLDIPRRNRPNHPEDSCSSASARAGGVSSISLGSGSGASTSLGPASLTCATEVAAGSLRAGGTSSAEGKSASVSSAASSGSSVATARLFSGASSLFFLKKLRHERAIGDFLLSLQTLRHDGCSPGGVLNHPVEHVRRGHRSFLVGDQQILAFCPVRVYHREESGQVEIVERRLGLVEDAEGRRSAPRLAEKDAEQEREREQRPLPAGQDPQRAPALPPEPKPYLHALLRQLQHAGGPGEHPRHHHPEGLLDPPERLRKTRLDLSV